MALMKNTINVSNNVNLILYTYRCLFFQTTTENVRCCSTASFDSMEIGRFWNLQHPRFVSFDSVEIRRFWNLQHPKFVNHYGTKMVDVWNVNKLTEARTKMEAGKLRTKAAQ